MRAVISSIISALSSERSSELSKQGMASFFSRKSRSEAVSEYLWNGPPLATNSGVLKTLYISIPEKRIRLALSRISFHDISAHPRVENESFILSDFL